MFFLSAFLFRFPINAKESVHFLLYVANVTILARKVFLYIRTFLKFWELSN